MRDIIACLITVDRRLFGKENYLSVSLKNLYRSDFFGSDRLAGKLRIFNSVADSDWIGNCLYWNQVVRKCPIIKFPEDMDQIVEFDRVDLSRHLIILNRNSSACENAGNALEVSGQYALDVNAKWVLFLEDDLDFCADFLGSVGRYLDHCTYHLFTDGKSLHDFDKFKIVSFGCPYPQPLEPNNLETRYWLYPISAFYGSQCFAIRPHDAISLGRYLQQNPTNRNPNEYDLMIHEWMHVTYPEHRYFLASAPSFVEHIGRESICTDLKETHRNPSWPGREWSYK